MVAGVVMSIAADQREAWSHIAQLQTAPYYSNRFSMDYVLQRFTF